jgi:hypothetical protein
MLVQVRRSLQYNGSLVVASENQATQTEDVALIQLTADYPTLFLTPRLLQLVLWPLRISAGVPDSMFGLGWTSGQSQPLSP